MKRKDIKAKKREKKQQKVKEKKEREAKKKFQVNAQSCFLDFNYLTIFINMPTHLDTL